MKLERVLSNLYLWFQTDDSRLTEAIITMYGYGMDETEIRRVISQAWNVALDAQED